MEDVAEVASEASNAEVYCISKSERRKRSTTKNLVAPMEDVHEMLALDQPDDATPIHADQSGATKIHILRSKKTKKSQDMSWDLLDEGPCTVTTITVLEFLLSYIRPSCRRKMAMVVQT